MKNSNKKVVIWLIVLAFIISILTGIIYFSERYSGKEAPASKNGYIDLSGWDFAAQGNVKLNGDWEFYPNRLLTPGDKWEDLQREALYIKVPGRWLGPATKGIISDKGVGTYRLQVKVNTSVNMYGLKTTNIRSSCKIFVNGRELGQSGNPETGVEDGYVGNVIPLTVFFPGDEKVLDIVIQVANLDYYNGGIIQSIYLGSEKNILNLYFRLNFMSVMNMSFLLLSGLYYFGIYIRRRKEKRLIYVSAICIAFSFIGAADGEKIILGLINFIPFMLVLKLKIALISLSILFVSLFIREMCSQLVSGRNMKVIGSAVGLGILLILAAPTPLMFIFEYLTGILNASLYAFIGILILISLIKQKHQGMSRAAVIFLLLGTLLNVFAYVSAALYFNSMIYNNIAPLFILIFLLMGIAVLLAEHYVKAYDGMETMSRKLIETDRLKDEFLINTSHEFKTPLHGIINIAQTILKKNKEEGAEEQRENLNYIVSLATRLSAMVNDIIDFQNLQNRSFKLNKKVFDINGNVQAAIEVLKHMRKGDTVRLINAVPAGEYYLYTDENRFQQIIMNLLSNSLKYTESGYVEISADKSDGYVYLRVEDTGSGIEEELQKELFKGKVHTGETNFSDFSSSGLGLSISKLLACSMGGDLALEWSELCTGSRFAVKLPEAQGTGDTGVDTEKNGTAIKDFNQKHWDELISTVSEDRLREVRGKGHKVLIVDDEPSNIKVLQDIFQEENYETHVAYNGYKALELIKEHKDLSLVLLDVMMPGISGYEVCRKIRQEYALFELPILLLTVRNTPEDVEAGLKAGANDFLVKPFDSRELRARAGTLGNLKEAVRNAIRMEMAFLQYQIKPHFLYNALSVIMSLCFKDGERAGTLLAELSNYLRCSFDIDPYNYMITLKKEISCVKSYVELEKARFGDRLTVCFNIEERFMSYTVPALTIQPMVENAIRHGLMKRLSGGTVTISAEMNNNELELRIADDGLGMPAEKQKQLLEHDFIGGGIGIKNVNKRLQNEYGKGLTIRSEEGAGTVIIMSIPVENMDSIVR